LAAAGFEASRTAHHLRVIRSLEFTLGLSPNRINLPDAFRKKRNEADYERAGVTCPRKCGQAGLEKNRCWGRKELLTRLGMRPMVTMRWSS